MTSRLRSLRDRALDFSLLNSGKRSNNLIYLAVGQWCHTIARNIGEKAFGYYVSDDLLAVD